MQALESEINFQRSEFQEKNTQVTSYMLHDNVHFPYKTVETNPCISPSKIIGTTEFCSSGQVSNKDDVIDFHVNYEQVPTKDAKSKDQANSLKHDVQPETNTFSVTDETKNNKKVNIQQEHISKKNHLQDGKSGINSKNYYPTILQQQKHALIVSQQGKGKIMNEYLLYVIALLNT